MRKININLYSVKDKADRRVFALMENYFAFAVLGICALLAINLLLFAIGGISSFSLIRTEKNWDKVSAQAQELAKIKNEINTLRNEKNQYSDLFASGADFSRLLAELYAAMPKNIWLEEIRFRKEVLTLKGYALRWKEDPLITVTSFINKFKKQEYFSSLFTQVSSKKSRRTEYKGQDATEFEIECRN